MNTQGDRKNNFCPLWGGGGCVLAPEKKEETGATMDLFGKIIAPFDNTLSMVDFSCVKIGIFSAIRKNINEEIVVDGERKLYCIGIVEAEEDWYPFKCDDDDQSHNDSGSEDKED
ncbi:hypothetical protein L2E82_20306 [Cichorium intybus]|uniref:Uncharacterized protein n=1 Tax=Cichorium intybus TaxID=13427 RepID=A0ACB9DTB2_CICIN|nr:hypothetical protein L2E82_20306 [Cichorium intybus]